MPAATGGQGSGRGKAGGEKGRSRLELYTHERMVDWLGIGQLVRTAIRATVAVTIGGFSDPRMVQAALRPRRPYRPIDVAADTDDGVWVDYLADTGDGWDSTYSMALCASHAIELRKDPCLDRNDLTLPRASLLLLGGDEVYPTPAGGGYRTRFLDPFRAALPAAVPLTPPPRSDQPILPVGGVEPPKMLATPGNHDWYDGLRGFTTLFCSGQYVGQWQTCQHTGYYVAKLPHGWWIWGLDLQLESEIDRPQYEYFARMEKALQAGDRVVLCTPEPSWIDEMERVERQRKTPDLPSQETQTPRFRSLRRIEELLGDHLVLVLTGDLHHYARYAPDSDAGPPPKTRHAPTRITCGGGGAYLYGTHQLPKAGTFTVGGGKQHYRLATAYPDARRSRCLRNGAWMLPCRNPGFCLALAGVYLFFVWVLQSVSRIPGVTTGSDSLAQSLAGLSVIPGHVGEAYGRAWRVMVLSPSAAVFALLVLACCIALSLRGVQHARWRAGIAGLLHGLLHLALAVASLWIFSRLNIHCLAIGADDPWQMLPFSIETLLFGGALGGLLFGGWMVITNAVLGLHAEDVLSSQRIADYKCMLRMRFHREGVTIYPLKLEKVCRRWDVSEGVTGPKIRVGRTWPVRAHSSSEGPRFRPVKGHWPHQVMRLIEAPFTLG